MEPLSLWTAIALTVLVPTVLLAFVGLLFLTSLTRYNRPIVPQKGYSKDKEMSLVEGRGPFRMFQDSVASKRELHVDR